MRGPTLSERISRSQSIRSASVRCGCAGCSRVHAAPPAWINLEVWGRGLNAVACRAIAGRRLSPALPRRADASVTSVLPGHRRRAVDTGNTPMISLAELQRRIDSGELSPRPRSPSRCEAIDAQDKTIGAFVCRAENVRAAEHRPAARHRGRHQGHHRYRGFSDRNGLGDLPGLAAARGCAGRDAAEAGRRHHHRQDHDHGVRRRTIRPRRSIRTITVTRRADRRRARRRRSAPA